jgi:hypothetical protein
MPTFKLTLVCDSTQENLSLFNKASVCESLNHYCDCQCRSHSGNGLSTTGPVFGDRRLRVIPGPLRPRWRSPRASRTSLALQQSWSLITGARPCDTITGTVAAAFTAFLTPGPGRRQPGWQGECSEADHRVRSTAMVACDDSDDDPSRRQGQPPSLRVTVESPAWRPLAPPPGGPAGPPVTGSPAAQRLAGDG